MGIPVLRLAMGPAFHTAPESEKGTEIALDLTAGLMFSAANWEGVGAVLVPELGYTFDGLGLHAFNATLGLGFGHPLGFVAYQPRLIVGRADGDRALGMRNGLAFHVLGDMGSLEVGHQFVEFNDHYHHDLRVMVGVNPASFIFVLSQL